MKKNSYFREFAKYTSLNVMGMIALSCYILADTYFVSKGLGANGLTALNLAIPIYSFIHGSGLMTGMGGATWYAIRKSQQDDASANRFFYLCGGPGRGLRGAVCGVGPVLFRRNHQTFGRG